MASQIFFSLPRGSLLEKKKKMRVFVLLLEKGLLCVWDVVGISVAVLSWPASQPLVDKCKGIVIFDRLVYMISCWK